MALLYNLFYNVLLLALPWSCIALFFYIVILHSSPTCIAIVMYCLGDQHPMCAICSVLSNDFIGVVLLFARPVSQPHLQVLHHNAAWHL